MHQFTQKLVHALSMDGSISPWTTSIFFGGKKSITALNIMNSSKGAIGMFYLFGFDTSTNRGH